MSLVFINTFPLFRQTYPARRACSLNHVGRTCRTVAVLNNGAGVQALVPDAWTRPETVVWELLESFRRDALEGIRMYVDRASRENSVKGQEPKVVVLYVGDSQEYALLVSVRAFRIGLVRWRGGGDCVVEVMVKGEREESRRFDVWLLWEQHRWCVREIFAV